MSIKVLFFASLREKLGVAQIDVALQTSETLSVSELRRSLASRGPEWTLLLDNDINAAANKAMVIEDHVLSPGDEVAFFPPVTGG
ncbi:MAG: molybdopterin converting factor subunit 1 [Pseudomonadales bacterium]